MSLVHRVRRREPEIDPTQRPPLLLLLHGIGSNELSMASLASAFDPRFLVISARSPIELGPFAFGWLHVTSTPDGPVIDPDEGKAAWNQAAGFIDEAVAAYDADPTRVYMAGFSQGGIVALATMLTSPEKLAGAVCMSGRLLPEVLPHVAEQRRLRGKPVLIVHGRLDPELRVAYGRSAAEQLRQLRLAVDYREFEIGHTTSQESLAVASTWLSEALDR